MAASPWYVEGLRIPQQPQIAYNCLAAGILITGFSLWAVAAKRWRGLQWAVAFVGLWLIVAPDTLSYRSGTMTWTNVVVGLAVFALSVLRIREQAPAPRPGTVKAEERLQDRLTGARLMYTAFLLLMGISYLMALTYLYLTHRGLDGKPGLSVADVAQSYYGNRSGTLLEAAIRGSMAGFSNPDSVILSSRGSSPAPQRGIMHPVSAPSSRTTVCGITVLRRV